MYITALYMISIIPVEIPISLRFRKVDWKSKGNVTVHY